MAGLVWSVQGCCGSMWAGLGETGQDGLSTAGWDVCYHHAMVVH